MSIKSGAQGNYKMPSAPDDWTDANEVQPSEVEPKRCGACGKIFLPTWYKQGRCSWCRAHKIPYMSETNLDKPF